MSNYDIPQNKFEFLLLKNYLGYACGLIKEEFKEEVELTTSIITLVSINLLVTNFLFTFLKDEIDDLQSIIDKTIHYKFPAVAFPSVIS